MVEYALGGRRSTTKMQRRWLLARYGLLRIPASTGKCAIVRTVLRNYRNIPR